jgi:hypothetical protein
MSDGVLARVVELPGDPKGMPLWVSPDYTGVVLDTE